jgi:hypothetical protein
MERPDPVEDPEPTDDPAPMRDPDPKVTPLDEDKKIEDGIEVNET